jgi:hypothetical protein
MTTSSENKPQPTAISTVVLLMLILAVVLSLNVLAYWILQERRLTNRHMGMLQGQALVIQHQVLEIGVLLQREAVARRVIMPAALPQDAGQ